MLSTVVFEELLSGLLERSYNLMQTVRVTADSELMDYGRNIIS